MGFISENRPVDWPKNGREFRLDCILDALDAFENNPSYRTREILLAIVNDNDLNQSNSIGLMRFTEYEVELINLIYVRAMRLNINSVKVYLYDIITEATRIQKMNSWCSVAIGDKSGDISYRIKPYEEILLLPLRLYHLAYQKYTVEKTLAFAEQLLNIVNETYNNCQCKEEIKKLTYAYSALLNDISYMRGSKKEKLWEFDRKELFLLFDIEAKLFSASSQNPAIRPYRGVLMTQISNFILKSRNGYNQDCICKYISKKVATISIDNHEIWMGNIKNLNDKREQKVVPELFEDDSWISFSWAKNLDFTPTRTYYVSSFSKSIHAEDMQSKYGECLYGYKNDRILDLIGPILMRYYKKIADTDVDLPDKKVLPEISQVITFDVLYDRDEAKNELVFLFKVINLFKMTDSEKHLFLQDILQYWILTVKDNEWKTERERRYVIFLYDEYEYIETRIEDEFLKEKTSLFLLPDFIMGDNPVKQTIRREMEAKQKSTMTREYLYCHNCFVQDYDSVQSGLEQAKKCPICGSDSIEIIYPKS